MKWLFLACWFFFISPASALTCNPIAIRDTIVLNIPSPALVIFHNISPHALFIAHQPEPQDDSIWSSRMEPERWSILSFDQKTLLLQCIESDPGHEQLRPCHTLLTVCQLPLASPHEKGANWFAENTVEPQLPQQAQSVVH